MAKLQKLKIENYRNIKSIELDFAGLNGKIVGLNRIGKTNVLEAICYLLTDKLLGGSSDIPSIKPAGAYKPMVVVEGTFLTDEGAVTLRKEFTEKWVKPRGSAVEELQGHTTNYFINGAKQARAKDFSDALETKFGIPTSLNGLDLYQLMLDPFYLGRNICGGKDWKLARSAIIDIIGDVIPEEIYGRNRDTLYAKADLEAHQYDEAETKKAIRGEIDGYKKQIERNESLLTEYSNIPDVEEEIYAKALQDDEKLADQIAKLKAGDSNPYADEVTKLQRELFDLQAKYQEANSAPVDHSKSEEIRKRLLAKSDEIAALERQQASVKSDVERASKDVEYLTIRKDSLKAQLLDLKDKINSIMVEETCPTCGQPLPKEKIEEAANKKRAELTKEYQEKLAQAKDTKQEILDKQDLLLTLTSKDFDVEMANLKNSYFSTKQELDSALAEEQAAIKKPDPAIQKRIAEINVRLDEIQRLIREGSASAYSQIEELKANRAKGQETLGKRYAYSQAQKRIEDLKAENSTLGNKQADAEQRLWAVGEFTKTKLDLFDSHMASAFESIRFQLVKENIKAGSYDEVCVPYIVSPATNNCTKTLFPDGSMSEQIYTGIQIIKEIRKAKGYDALPILFDQGGELDDESAIKVALNAEAQIIAVKVEGNGKTPTFKPFN